MGWTGKCFRDTTKILWFLQVVNNEKSLDGLSVAEVGLISQFYTHTKPVKIIEFWSWKVLFIQFAIESDIWRKQSSREQKWQCQNNKILKYVLMKILFPYLHT